MSYQSKYTGQEIDNKLDKIGEVGVLDHCYCDLPSIAPEAGQILSLQYRSGNMKLQDGKVIIKSGQSVQINMSVSYSGASTNASIKYTIKDFTNNIDIQSFNPYRGDSKYEYGSSISAQFTNDTDIDCEVGIFVNTIVVSDTIRGDYSYFTVHEIGRAMVIPNEYKEVELLSAPVAYKQGGGSHTTVNQYITLLDNIFNYDELVFKFCAEFSNGSLAGLTEYRMLTSNHQYVLTGDPVQQLILAIPTQNVRQLLFIFTANNTIHAQSTCMTSGSGDGKFHILSIKGIKY